MTPIRDQEHGFTLVETLVAMLLFSILSVGFYQVMFSGVQGGETTGDIARISEEARIGLNRILRDTRETGGHCFSGASPTCGLVTASPTSYSIEVDFNNNRVVDYADNEYLRYTFDAANNAITIASLDNTGAVLSGPEVLITGVSAIPGRDVFDYSSNYLEYDWMDQNQTANTPDGVTEWQEIDRPPLGVNGVGDRDGTLDDLGDDNPREIFFISEINISFRVSSGSRRTEFFNQASLRNRRFGTS
jgi:prepilin-type N-terminal cleavage/methylation domain-containing protein